MRLIPEPKLTTPPREKPLEPETKAVLDDIRSVLADAETQAPWKDVDLEDRGARDRG